MVRLIVAADKKAVGITISLPPESIKLLDDNRGQQTRSSFINNLIKGEV